MKIKQNEIIEYAIKEFAKYSYEEASINRICLENSVTKGQLYHYFSGKEDLYLSCLKKVYQEIEEFHKQKDFNDFSNISSSIKDYMKIRFDFFEKNPEYSQVFFQTINRKSLTLKKEIVEIARPFKESNIQFFKKILKEHHLQKGIDEEKAIEFYLMVFEAYNLNLDLNNPLFLQQHQTEVMELIKMVLYGTLERGCDIND